MENKKTNPLEDLLKKRMNEDLNEMQGPEESLKDALRARIKGKEKNEAQEGFSLLSLFRIKLKLQYVAMLCLLVGALTFYAGKNQSAEVSESGKNTKSDSLNLASSSAKENMFLIKRFAVSLN